MTMSLPESVAMAQLSPHSKSGWVWERGSGGNGDLPSQRNSTSRPWRLTVLRTSISKSTSKLSSIDAGYDEYNRNSGSESSPVSLRMRQTKELIAMHIPLFLRLLSTSDGANSPRGIRVMPRFYRQSGQ